MIKNKELAHDGSKHQDSRRTTKPELGPMQNGEEMSPQAQDSNKAGGAAAKEEEKSQTPQTYLRLGLPILIHGFTNVKELYSKIVEAYEWEYPEM
ncbi:unnamed protein product [Coregonus sp. 'balchen']|nr:unnamed protein product [Coregonus sp. 'balchen']